ncbi:asparaginase [Pelagibacterium montanilacus]|uniref:asparaginase n=1 Tax=Pelagibacterium montanilacus TaxID=2185280 RepID=UPI000F8F6587|nr:asparaginase [Pelagibacterium montanilacus]
MPTNPELARFVRGPLTENRHTGAICVCGPDGDILAAVGDAGRAVFPRSAIKTMQALAMFSSGAAEMFGIEGEALAIACASHNGEKAHTDLVARILARLDLDADALECGAHPPLDSATRRDMLARGEKPSALHNACSGKHAGMLAVARALGADPQGYVRPDHPVQKEVRARIEAVIGQELAPGQCGTDGCSIPTCAAPLSAFAGGMARMASGKGLDDATGAAARTILDAVTAHPFFVGGSRSFDTELMGAFAGRLSIKYGADGVFCGALRDRGLGFALKCDDGSVPAATAMVANLLLGIAAPDGEAKAILERNARKVVRNWTGLEVGVLEADAAARIRV